MKLMTWNIQWGRGADGRVDLERIVSDASRFSDFDVLCLQEVSSAYPELPGNDDKDQFAELARLLPGFSAVAGVATDAPYPGGGRRAFGNMILSRYPVLQVFRHLLPWPVQAGIKSMQRIALEATLDVPAQPLRITTTHLEYYSAMQRRAQVERLRALHREAVSHAHNTCTAEPRDGPFCVPPRGAPAILTGDFNFLPDSEDMSLLTSPIDAATPAYRDAWNVAHPSRPRPPTVGLYDKAQWPEDPFTFDFIFVSADLAAKVKDVRVDQNSAASDHQPMVVELHD